MLKFSILVLCVLSLGLFTSCGVGGFVKAYQTVDRKPGSFNGNIFSSPYNSYKIGELGNNWRSINVSKGDAAFYNKLGNSTITVNSDCRKAKRGYSLKALSNSLVVGLKDKEIIERSEIDLDKSSGIYTEYDALLNEELISVATVVYKSEKCNYDFSYSAYPEDFSKNIDDYLNFLKDFEELSAND